MDINKAIKKQKKSYKRFVLFHSFVFFILPLIMVISGKVTLFILSYLLLIELVILFSLTIRINKEAFKYEYKDNKLKVKTGLFKNWYYLNCDKVSMIHTEEYEGDIQIIIITKSKFRSRYIKPLDIEFLQKHAYVSHVYNRMKVMNPETIFYYTIVKNGGFLKYRLLLDMYKGCVGAFHSEATIKDIKLWNEH